MSRTFESNVLSRDVTPESVFFDRRRFLTALGLSGISMAAGPAVLATPPREPELLGLPYENDDVFPATRNDGFAVPDAIERKGCLRWSLLIGRPQIHENTSETPDFSTPLHLSDERHPVQGLLQARVRQLWKAGHQHRWPRLVYHEVGSSPAVPM